MQRQRKTEKKKTKKTNENSHCLQGSYTVEAAAVVSMTFLVLGALILGTFFVHDRAVMQSIVCEAASAGSNFATLEERTEAAAAAADHGSDKRFLGSRGAAVSAGVGEQSVTCLGNASFPVPGMAAKLMSGGNFPVLCSWESQAVDPAEVIRMIRGAELVLDHLQ